MDEYKSDGENNKVEEKVIEKAEIKELDNIEIDFKNKISDDKFGQEKFNNGFNDEKVTNPGVIYNQNKNYTKRK